MTSSLTAEPPTSPSWPGDSRAGSPPSTPSALITREGERALRATLERLRQQLEVDFAGRMRDDRGYGEAAGNDEYLQTLEEASVLNARIASLEALLESAAVVADPETSAEIAAIGTRVKVEDLGSSKASQYELIGDYEKRRSNAVSASSPVGRALMGRTPGDEVEVALPRGNSRSLRVVEVRPASVG